MSKVSFIGSSTVKSMVCASILALALLNFVTPRSNAAESSGTADGSISFTLDDGFTKSLKFTAVANSDGSASGRMIFSGPAEFPDQDVDGTGSAGYSGKIEDLFIQAEFDSMVVERNRAVMSGVVTGATLSDYIGQRVLLVVEDNADGIGERGDKFTWGIYKPAEKGWIPADAELKEDSGWSMTWLATDAERRDDKGIQITRDWVLNCQTFPLSSYDFVNPTQGDGDILVQP
ncbi:MAG TPA: hypothetical protein VIW80_22395 [Pyrinomonadaceae bacterium]